jgi:hypothetical protein
MVKIEDVVVEKEKGPLRNVFVEKIPLKILFDLLDKICSVIEGRGVEKGVRLFYYISEYEYRKMVFDGLHIAFLNSIRNYYSAFFSRYWEREFTYNAFKTILRQICKTHGIRYEKESHVVNSEIVASYLIYV